VTETLRLVWTDPPPSVYAPGRFTSAQPGPTMTDPRLSAASAPPPIADRRSLNLPNLITVSRFVLSLVLFVLIDLDGWWRTAAVVFVVAAFTDFLDGYLARKYGQVTVLGRILDPFVDKIIICGSFIFLQGKTAEGLDSGVTDWMTFVIVAREMFITGLRAVLEQHGRDFSAKWSGKIKMIVQCATVPLCLLTLSRVFLADVEPYASQTQITQVRDVLLWATVAITVYSGVEYVVRAVRMWDADR
jgi:CDP-diacylglycerol--glycerol-3-phosphate 3-phosphatidyltransferase